MANTSVFIPVITPVVTDSTLTGDGTVGSPLALAASHLSPAGSDTQVQFNDGGVFGGDAGLTYVKATNALTILGPVTVTTSDTNTGTSLTLNQNEVGPPADTVLAINTVNGNPYGILFTNATNSHSFGMYLDDDGVETFDSAELLAIGVPLTVSGHTQIFAATHLDTTYNFALQVLGGLVVDGTTEFGGIASIFDTAGFDNTSDLYGFWGSPRASGNSVLAKLTGVYLQPQVNDTAAVTVVFGNYFNPLPKAAGATITNSVAFYSSDLAGYGTNPYYFWADSQGVFRIREDNVADSGSFPQAIPSLYNPRFTKYTYGLANYERIVDQWVNNIAQHGTEAGGTGTLRKQQLIGAGLILGADILPTADPHVAGQIWSNSNVLTRSAG